MKNNSQIRSHFVPQSYLKGFSFAAKDKSKRLYVCSRDKIKDNMPISFRSKTAYEICYRYDLYKVSEELVKKYLGIDIDSQYIEKNAFKKFEENWVSLSSSITDTAATDNRILISLDKAILFIKAVVSFKRRNLSSYESLSIKQTLKTSTDDFKDWLRSNEAHFMSECTKKGMTKEEYFLYLDQLMYDPKYITLLSNLLLIKDSYGDDTIFNRLPHFLLNKKWSLFVNETQSQFVTSDNPGICLDGNGEIFDKFFFKEFIFYFPITPKYCLCITDDDEETIFRSQKLISKSISVASALPKDILLFNRRQLYVANDEIYSSSESTLKSVALDFKSTFNY